MSNYNIGRAEGEIRIKYDGGGVDEAEKDLGKFNKNVDEGNKKSKASAQQVGEAASVVGKGFAAAGGAIAAGFAVAVKSAVGFEERMSAVKAVSGASGDEMKKLTQLSLDLGASTKYNAAEAAQAIEELVKAGVSVPDVMNGAAKATVNLAAAGEIDLPEAAAIASNAMNQFGLSAQKMPRIADMIAGAANASAIDVKEFGYSIAQSGAVAATAGVSFDDLSVAIAEMGNAGIKGSDAGTSIKTFLTNLIPTTDKARGLFNQLGLIATDTTGVMGKLAKYGIKPASDSFKDVEAAISKYVAASGQGEVGTAKNLKATNKMATGLGILQNKFFDAEGNMKSFGEVQQILAESLKGMDSEERLGTLTELFGSDAVRAASVFAKNGSKGFNDMAEAMGKVTAEQVAMERQNNLAGQWEELTGSLETMAIEIGQIVLPWLSQLVDFIQKLVGAWQKLSPSTKKIMVIIAALVGVFMLLVGAVLMLIAPMIAMFGTIAAAGTALLPVIGIVMLIIAALMLLVAAVILVVKNWDKIKAFAIKIWTAIKDFFVGLWEAITDIFHSAVDGITGFFKGAWGSIVSFFTEIWSGIVEFFSGIWARIIEVVTNAWKWISQAVSTGVDFVKGILTTALNVLLAPWRAFWNVFGGLFTAIWDLIKAVGELAMKAVVFAIMFQADALRKFWETVWGAVSGFFVDVWNGIVGFVGPKVDWIREKVVSGVTWIRDKVSGILRAIGNFFVNTWNKIVAIHVAVFNRIVSSVTGFATRLWTPIQSRLDAIRKKFTDIWNSVVTTLRTAWDKMVSYAGQKITALWNKITGIRDRIVNAFKNAGNWLIDAGKRIIQGLIDGLTARIRRVTDLLRDLTNKIPSWKGPASRDEKLLAENGGLIMQGLIDAMAAGIPDVEAMLGGLTTRIPGMMGNSSTVTNTTTRATTNNYGATVHQTVTNNYPVAERGSKATNRSLQLAGAFGEAA